MRNVRLAFRTLPTPFVTIVAIVSLALGIGANAAIFSLFNQMLLRPLPVQEPERLVNLARRGRSRARTSCNKAGDCDEVFSYPMFRDLERAQTVFTGIAAHRIFGANLGATAARRERRAACWCRAATSPCSGSAGARPAARPRTTTGAWRIARRPS